MKIVSYYLYSNNPSLETPLGAGMSPMRIGALFVAKKLIKPGQNYDHYTVVSIRRYIEETKVKATEEQKEKWRLKYGCEAQKGSLYISVDPTDIKFPKDSGISENEKIKYLIGDNNGSYPIEKKIRID